MPLALVFGQSGCTDQLDGKSVGANTKKGTMSQSSWLTIDQAAALVGKSTSTVRRALASVPGAYVRRDGAKIYLAKGWFVNRWKPVEANEKPAEAANDLRGYIASLEADNAAKTEIIARMSETVRQLTAFSSALLLDRNKQPAEPGTDAQTGFDAYTWLAIVAAALAGGLAVWVFIA